ncbi:(2Fe-2S)-binding protein [Agrobacterium vaccinii]|uniref:(2Fe-2S)-binding protein n=1 Tax=Agrobacterium vaccinii TaxID=2735528 RepID=UPI001E3C5947|nr:(2Fe-2S)-binding protein [Agrobacterium vaccinii]
MSDPRRLPESKDLHRPPAVSITVNGEPTLAHPGESLAAALMASGHSGFRRTQSGALRAPYCNMGVCFDCLVTVDGQSGQRSCLIPVRADMVVELENV